MNLEKRKSLLKNALEECRGLGKITTHDIITLFVDFYQKNKLVENPDEVVFDWEGDLEIFGYDEIDIVLFQRVHNLVLIIERRTRPYLSKDEEQLKLFLEYKNQLLSEDLKRFLPEKLKKIIQSDLRVTEFLDRIEDNEAYLELKDKVPDFIKINSHYDA